MNNIIKSYKEFSEKDIKSLSIKTSEKDGSYQFIYLSGKNVIFSGPIIIFKNKVGINTFKFAISTEPKKNYRRFCGFLRHIKDSLSKKISMISKKTFGKYFSKKYIKSKLMYDIVNIKGQIKLKMFNGKDGKLTFKMIESVKDNIEKKVFISEEEADKLPKDVKIFKIKKTGKLFYKKVKVANKMSEIKGLNIDNFSKKFPSGTMFIPHILLDHLYITSTNNIEINLVIYGLKLHKLSSSNKKRIYNYSDSDEESDQDYISGNEEIIEVKNKDNNKEEKNMKGNDNKKSEEIIIEDKSYDSSEYEGEYGDNEDNNDDIDFYDK